MGGKDNPGPAVHARQLFDRDGIAQHIHAGPAVLFRIGNAHEPHLSELSHRLAREAIRLIKLKRLGLNLLLRKLPDAFTKLFMFLCGCK